MSTVWLVKLIFSHLVSDFLLQSKKWIDDRREKHFLSPWLYVHGLITGALALLFIGVDYWQYALIIMVSHILIDGWKSYMPDSITYFLIDQLLHILVILGCWYFAFYSSDDFSEFVKNIGSNTNFWIVAAAYLFLSFPSGIIIGLMTRRWSRQLANNISLANAGKWIGILERILILTFLLQGQYGAIGLLITAKGLLRFSEKDRQEEKTEYVLIGSLISVSFAVLIGILVVELTEQFS